VRKVFTKKHFKSSCLSMFYIGLLFLICALPQSMSFASDKEARTQAHNAVVPLASYALGTFKRVESIDLKKENLNRLNGIIDELPFYVRPVAKPKLLKIASSFDRFEIILKQGALGIKTDSFKSFVWTKVDGKYRQFKNTTRGDFKLRRWIENGVLYTEANKDGALKLSRYEFAPDGSLNINVTVTSPYLKAPLILNYLYQRLTF